MQDVAEADAPAWLDAIPNMTSSEVLRGIADELGLQVTIVDPAQPPRRDILLAATAGAVQATGSRRVFSRRALLTGRFGGGR